MYVSVCAIYVPKACGGKKRALDPWSWSCRSVLLMLSVSASDGVGFSSSDKKRKLETKQEPKHSKKLKKREMNNRKDAKLKRKK